jgi:hypothetical protein
MVWMIFLCFLHIILEFTLGFPSQSTWVRLAKYTAIQSFVWVTFLIECACYLDLLVSENISLSWDLSHKGLGSCLHLFPATQTIHTLNLRPNSYVKFNIQVRITQNSSAIKDWQVHGNVQDPICRGDHISRAIKHVLNPRQDHRWFKHYQGLDKFMAIVAKTWYVEANNISRDIKNILNPRQDHRQFKHNQGTFKFMAMFTKTQYVEANHNPRAIKHILNPNQDHRQFKHRQGVDKLNDNAFQDTICSGWS